MKATVLLDRGNVNKSAPLPLNLMVSLTAPEVPEEKRTPTDLVLVLDISSSMGEAAVVGAQPRTKMSLVQEAAKRLVDQLKSSDSLAVIAFDDRIEDKLLEMNWATDDQREAAKRRIDRLFPRGSTDLAAAAVTGIRILKEVPVCSGRSRRVILFTDGIATAGLTDHVAIVYAASQTAGTTNPLTTIGFGQTVGTGTGGYNPEVLSSMAGATGGNFYHAEGESGTLDAFAKELGSLRAIAATDVTAEVTLKNNLTLVGVLNEHVGGLEEGSARMRIGAMYGGETQHLVLVLKAPPVKKASPRSVLAATVKATALLSDGTPWQWESQATFKYTSPSKATKNPNPAVEEEAVRLLAAKFTREAYTRAATGKYAEAVQVIDDILPRARMLTSEKGKLLVTSLETLRTIVGNPRVFHHQSGNVFATTHSLGSGRAAGSTIADEACQTIHQTRTLHEMSGSGPAKGTKPGRQ